MITPTAYETDLSDLLVSLIVKSFCYEVFQIISFPANLSNLLRLYQPANDPINPDWISGRVNDFKPRDLMPIIRSIPLGICCLPSRNASRIRRLIRLRVTALGNSFLLTAMPSLEYPRLLDRERISRKQDLLI